MAKVKIFILFFGCLLYSNQVFSIAETLSEKATNPITSLSQLQLENDFTSSNYGSKGCSNEGLIKPLIALNKTAWIPFEQLIRFKIQVPTLPKSSTTKQGTSLGDTQFFDLFITEELSWGRWGVGPMAIFPTATKLDAGQGKWQVGPALGISILKFPGWQIGFIAQNPISFAGNSSKSYQNYLLFQPFIIKHFRKSWYIVSNAEWTIDWYHHVEQIPINLGIGHTFTLVGKQKIDTSLQLEWMAYQNATKVFGFVPHFTMKFSFNFLLGE